MLSRYELSPLANLVVTLTLLVGVFFGMPSLDFFGHTLHYLHLHAVLEAASTICILGAAALGLRYRTQHPEGGRLVLLAAGLLAVAMIDVMHILSYEDMPNFITASNPQKAINFWLASRYWAALTLLTVSLGASGVGMANSVGRVGLLFAINLSIVSLVFWVGIFHESWLPQTFVPGRGLTGFKIVIELVIASMFALAAWRFFRMPNLQGGINYRLLAAAAWVFGLTEIYLCMYSDVTDIFNVAGHIYKVIGSVLLVLAVIPVAQTKLAEDGTLARYLRS